MKKYCPKCKQSKSLSEFNKGKYAKDGLQYKCRECSKKYYQINKIRIDKRNKEYGQIHKIEKAKYYEKYRKTDVGKKARRGAHLKHSYGITLEQHKQMYIRQNGCCAICNMPVEYSKIHTDHDHKTDKVRGLLCHNCNAGIGMLKENINILRNAISYLGK